VNDSLSENNTEIIMKQEEIVNMKVADGFPISRE
jgi:hypothetical protein